MKAVDIRLIFIIIFTVITPFLPLLSGCRIQNREAEKQQIPLADPGFVKELEAEWKKQISEIEKSMELTGKENPVFGAAAGEWHSFQGDIGNTGHSAVSYMGTTIEKAWEFDIGDHAWEYTAEMSSWSMSPVYARVNGRGMLFTGCHDRNFYALDAESGKMVWQRPLGGLSLSAPLFTVTPSGTSCVIAACSDRSVYCLEADTGRIIWSRALAEWSETVEPAVPGSPVLWKTGSSSFTAMTLFHSDKAFLRSVQQGMAVLLNPETGDIVSKRIISGSPLSSPCIGKFGEKGVFYTADRGGCVYALSLPDFRLLWKRVVSGRIFGGPSFFNTQSGPVTAIADMYGMITLLNALTGDVIRTFKTGFFVNATPAVSGSRAFSKTAFENLFVSSPRIYAGGFDRIVHAYEVDKGEKLFSFSTGKYVSSNLFSCIINRREAIIFASLDRNLYALDAVTGKELFRHTTDDMLWSHERPGQTVWPGPIPAGKLIVFPTPGNRIMAFRIK